MQLVLNHEKQKLKYVMWKRFRLKGVTHYTFFLSFLCIFFPSKGTKCKVKGKKILNKKKQIQLKPIWHSSMNVTDCEIF